MEPSDLNQCPFSDHLIVCGLGHVGNRILNFAVSLGEQAVVITRETADGWCGEQSRFPIIVGDARDNKLLYNAGISRAKAILIVTNDDLANVSIALDARRINPGLLIVVRIFDQELAAHLEQSIKVRALSTSALAAPAFVAAALGGSILGEFEANGEHCRIREPQVPHGSPLAGKTIEQWSRESSQAVLALQRDGKMLIHPAGKTEIHPGDRLTLLGFTQGNEKLSVCAHEDDSCVSPLQTLRAGLREWWRELPIGLRTVGLAFAAVVFLSVIVFHIQLHMPLVDSLYFVITTVTTVGYGDYNLINASPYMKLYGSFLMLCGAGIMATLFSVVTDQILKTRFRDVWARGCAQFKGHIIVTGLGNIGFRVVRELVRNGETVVAIEQQESGNFIQAARELAPVVIGNARTDETLRRAGLAGAKAIIAATDNDVVNLSTGLRTKRAHPSCRTVLRIFDFDLAEKLQRNLEVDSVLCTSSAAAPTFLGSVLCPGTVHGLQLPGGLVFIFNRALKADSSSAPLGKREAALFVKPIGAAKFELATDDRALAVGDRVIGVRWCPFIERQ